MFIGDEPARLAFLPARGESLRVRNSYLDATNAVTFEEGRDFTVDFAEGALRRTAQSRLPDFRTNLLFGQREFDHSKFPGFGNGGFFAFVDYACTNDAPWPAQANQSSFLATTQRKLLAGRPVTIVAFGDSIAAGGDATRPELIFWERWAEGLRRRYPRARITTVNGATGGDSTVQGLRRLQAKVLDARPDLVLVGFGMNDHNKGGVPVTAFATNLAVMVDRLRGANSAEVVLFSAFPPNPRWKFGSQRMEEYAAATERVAREKFCAYADVFRNWQTLAARKKPEDLLGNNINHPNDFGHGIYARVLEAMGL